MYNVFTYTKDNMAEAQAAYALYRQEGRKRMYKIFAVIGVVAAIVVLFIKQVDNFFAFALISFALLMWSETRYMKNSITERAKTNLNHNFEQQFNYGEATIETYLDDNVRMIQNGKTSTLEWSQLKVFLETARLLVLVFEVPEAGNRLIPIGKDDFETGSYEELVALILEKRPDLAKRAEMNAKEAAKRGKSKGMDKVFNKLAKSPKQEETPKKDRSELFESEEDVTEQEAQDVQETQDVQEAQDTQEPQDSPEEPTED